jgi:hypothetical protein
VPDQDRQGGEHRVEGNAAVVVREVAQRQVTGVDDIDVEVYDDGPGRGGHPGDGLLGDLLRCAGQVRAGEVSDAALLEERVPGGVHLPRIAADQAQPRRVDESARAVQAGQSGRAWPEQMGDPHGVEDPGLGVLRRSHVGVSVDVDQARVVTDPSESRHDAEREGAVAAEHEGPASVPDHAGHPVGESDRRGHHRVEIALARVGRVGDEWSDR